MAHKFSLNFKHSWITRRGPKLITLGLGNRRSSVHPGTKKCYEYVIKNTEESTPENVQLAPVRHSQQPWLYGPATVISSRSIVYPCIRGKCALPCPCRICKKQHPRCRAGQSCSCAECKMFYEDHTNFHGCLHHGCKSCFNILSVLPFFNFFFLDKSRKPENLDVFIEGKIEPTFELPRGTGMRFDMVPHFLARHRWEEKLENWNSGVQDDAIWCYGCNTMFFSTGRLSEHILSTHSVSKMFRHHFENDDTKPQLLELHCEQCSRSFGTKGELTRHLQSVHYQERIECPDCSMTFSRKDNFKLHKKNKHAVTSHMVKFVNLKCELCHKSFSCKSALKRHTQEACNVEKEVYVMTCDCCETTFIRTNDLRRHQQNRDNHDGSAKFMCTICDKKMCNRKLLKSHIRNEHANIERDSEIFKVVSERKPAETTETFECEFCDKRFAREDTLMQHKVTHNVAKKIKCEHCNCKFTLRNNYTRHMKEAHGEDGSPQHVCSLCEKHFCNGKLLSGHINACHKNFPCPICNQSFTFKQNLEYHVRKRVAVSCKDCGKVFCNNKAYSEHNNLLHPKSVE